MAVLLPVDGEGIEVVAAEVEHREELVHDALAQPALGVLAHGVVGVPATAVVAAQIVKLAQGRATHLHPGLLLFHRRVDAAHYLRDVVAALALAHRLLPVLWIADVVEVDTVHIVAAHYLAAYLGDVVARAGFLGVHESLVAYLAHQGGVALVELGAAGGLPLAHRNGHYPGVQLHAAAVALLDGKLQRVVAGVLAGLAGQAGVPGLIVGGIEGGGTDARLEQHRVHVGGGQLVEYVAQLLFLAFSGRWVGGLGERPVEIAQGGEPYSPHFPLRGLGIHLQGRQGQAGYQKYLTHNLCKVTSFSRIIHRRHRFFIALFSLSSANCCLR